MFHHIAKFTFLGLGMVSFSTATPASADQLINDNLVVSGDLICVGDGCLGSTPALQIPGREGLRISSPGPAVRFESNQIIPGFPNNTWQLTANDAMVGGREIFILEDASGGTEPFSVAAGAPSAAIAVSASGRVGMGTALPGQDIHIKTGNNPSVRLEQDGSGGFIPQTWDFAGNGTLFFVRDVTNGNKLPFVVRAGAPNNAFGINSNGFVGVGTSSAESNFHVRGPGNQVARIQSTNNGNTSLQLKSSSQQRKIVALNAANQVQSQILMYNEQIRLIGPNGDPANTYLIAGPGGISTRGPSCNPGPCDATFDPDAFTVPSIEDHAAYMWENQHLWGVGPTSSDQMINLTEKTGGMLHELEVAHIYIEQLHHRLEAQAEEKTALTERVNTQEDLALQQSAIIADLTKRLEALETQ